MDADTTASYYQAIPVLEAQEQLIAFTIADWPRAKKSKREELHRKIHKIAFPNTYSRPVSIAELAKMLGLGTMK